jgi:hypothetical protein
LTPEQKTARIVALGKSIQGLQQGIDVWSKRLIVMVLTLDEKTKNLYQHNICASPDCLQCGGAQERIRAVQVKWMQDNLNAVKAELEGLMDEKNQVDQGPLCAR